MAVGLYVLEGHGPSNVLAGRVRSTRTGSTRRTPSREEKTSQTDPFEGLLCKKRTGNRSEISRSTTINTRLLYPVCNCQASALLPVWLKPAEVTTPWFPLSPLIHTILLGRGIAFSSTSGELMKFGRKHVWTSRNPVEGASMPVL